MLKTQKSQKIQFKKPNTRTRRKFGQVEEKKSRTKSKKDNSGKFKMLKKVPMKESSRKLKNIIEAQDPLKRRLK